MAERSRRARGSPASASPMAWRMAAVAYPVGLVCERGGTACVGHLMQLNTISEIVRREFLCKCPGTLRSAPSLREWTSEVDDTIRRISRHPELFDTEEEWRKFHEEEKSSNWTHLPLVLVALPPLGAIIHGSVCWSSGRRWISY